MSSKTNRRRRKKGRTLKMKGDQFAPPKRRAPGPKPKPSYPFHVSLAPALEGAKDRLIARLKVWRDRISYEKLDCRFEIEPTPSLFSSMYHEDVPNTVTIQFVNKCKNQDPKPKDHDPDSYNLFSPNWKEVIPLHGSPVRIKYGASDEDIVRAFYQCIEEMENHERDEWFKIKIDKDKFPDVQEYQRPFNPHNAPFNQAKTEAERGFLRRQWKMTEAERGLEKVKASTLGDLIKEKAA